MAPGSGPAGAWPGDPDGAYGACGARTVDVVPGANSRARAAAPTTDGKVLVAGEAGTDALVMRLASGALDTTFGTSGRTLVSVTGNGRYDAVAMTFGGGALVGGRRVNGASTDSVVARLKSNGKLDTTFAGNGKLTFDAGGADGVTAVAVTSDGGAIVAGPAGPGGFVARYTAAGVLDRSWAGDGRRDGLGLDIAGIAPRADGSVYVAGAATTSPSDWRVMRLASDGSTDSGFGGPSGVTLDLGGDDRASAITTGPGGTVVVTGSGSGASGHGQTIVRRFGSDGAEDSSFAAFRDSFGVDDQPVAVVRTAGGKLVVAANSRVGSDNDIVLLRLEDDGTPDAGFGIDGATVTDAGRRSVVAGVAVPADGRPLAVGSVRRSGHDRVAFWRHQADGSSSGPPVQGVVLDAYGGVHGWSARCHGGAVAVSGNPYWPGWDIARGVAVLPGGGAIEVDAFGGAHPLTVGDGARPKVHGTPYWLGWDIVRGVAVVPEGTGGYELDGYGGLHPFSIGRGPAPPRLSGTPYWLGQDMARGIALMPDGHGGYLVDRTGRIYAFGGAPKPNAGGPSWPGLDVARGIALAPDGSGGWVLDFLGGLHRFGTGGDPAPASTTDGPYWGAPLARGAASMP